MHANARVRAHGLYSYIDEVFISKQPQTVRKHLLEGCMRVTQAYGPKQLSCLMMRCFVLGLVSVYVHVHVYVVCVYLPAHGKAPPH